MPGKPILSTQLLVPLGTLIAAITVTVTCMTYVNARTVDQTTIKLQVDALTHRVDAAEARLDKGDARWDQIRDDLSKIKERLGIVEAVKGEK